MQVGNKLRPSIKDTIEEYALADNIKISFEEGVLKAISYDKASLGKF